MWRFSFWTGFCHSSDPPFTPEEKKLVAENVYAHVWQPAMNGEFCESGLMAALRRRQSSPRLWRPGS